CLRSLPRLGPTCPVCALPTGAGEVCGHCLASPPPFDATVAAFTYAFPVDRLLHAFKYHGRLALAEWGANAILSERARHSAAYLPDRLVPLPPAPQRPPQPAYNQPLHAA